MPTTTPSPPLSAPSERRIRFAPHDEILNPDEPAISSDSDDGTPSTPPRPINPRMRRDPPSPTESVSSASSSEGPSTPSPVVGRRFTDLKSPYPTFNTGGDAIVLHPSLNMNASFVWDMARSPQGFLHLCDDEPAARWEIDREPLSDLTLTLEGIYEWTISVFAREDNAPYPTMKDIFLAIFENVSKMVGKDVVDRLHPHTRRRVFAGREARCREFSLNSAEEPLRRIDFLVGARRFLGVSAPLGAQNLVLNVGILPSQN